MCGVFVCSSEFCLKSACDLLFFMRQAWRSISTRDWQKKVDEITKRTDIPILDLLDEIDAHDRMACICTRHLINACIDGGFGCEWLFRFYVYVRVQFRFNRQQSAYLVNMWNPSYNACVQASLTTWQPFSNSWTTWGTLQAWALRGTLEPSKLQTYVGFPLSTRMEVFQQSVFRLTMKSNIGTSTYVDQKTSIIRQPILFHIYDRLNVVLEYASIQLQRTKFGDSWTCAVCRTFWSCPQRFEPRWAVLGVVKHYAGPRGVFNVCFGS